MKKILLALSLFISSLSFVTNSFASSALIEASWLNQHLDDKDILLLDIRTKEYFDYVRIPNSVHSSYSSWRSPQSTILRKMLPSKTALESLLSQSGVTQESHIIIISAGESASDLAAASRVFWTLEQIGHEKKSILNGGIITWAKNRFSLTQAKAPAATKSNYPITAIKDQVNAQTVLKAIKQNKQIIDTRSIAEFKGLIHSADERGGTIKNSKPLPYDWFVQQGSGQVHSLKDLNTITQSINYDNQQETYVYCHTGHRAALSWFVLHEVLGNKNAKLYDGSTRDWATQPQLPMTAEISLEH